MSIEHMVWHGEGARAFYGLSHKFKKSLQKRELGGLIIEGNFNSEVI
jgi:hypothetical protein